MALNIDIGRVAIDGSHYYIGTDTTYISKYNPANRSGRLTHIEIYAHTSMTGCEVATFHQSDTNVFVTRDTHYIGNVAAGAKRSFDVDLEVEAGDFIGIHFVTGQIELDGGISCGNWFLNGDYIPQENPVTFVVSGTTYAMMLYGSGTIVAPTVTTQAVTGIGGYTAIGNGNITDTGGVNATKRGICWNTTGNPTISDNKSEQTGSFGTGAFTRSITGLSPNVKYYVKAYAYNEAGHAYGNEVNFTTSKVKPTVTVQAPTNVLTTAVTANGNITVLGGENSTHRGFKYGLTQDDTWDAHDEGSYGVGAYTKSITENLQANTTYWIRAYATNSVGTSYSAWISFQTAASGIIPAGTLINVCSDYLGFTYKLQRSETDDGETYTGYFTINTDLAEKKGLNIYKRILDLHLYFRCEASGTAEIYTKRDSEAEFQYLGSVGLTDVTEPTIIIKHLAIDVRAKDYDFKVSFGNACRFLGVVFEFIPGGER